MSKRYIFLFILLSGCTQTTPPVYEGHSTSALPTAKGVKDCEVLAVMVAKDDTMDKEADQAYGVGDDNIFTYQEFSVSSNNAMEYPALQQLNDYNLRSAYQSKKKPGEADTLYLINDFTQYPKMHADTALIIDNISVFNGDRSDLNKWKKSVKIRDVEIHHLNRCYGKFTLANTYKAQFVALPLGIAVLHGVKDSILFIIRNVYTPLAGNTAGYSISEIKLDGINPAL